MRKSTALRLSGFTGAVGLAVVLAGAAVGGTGAYFTDSKSGTVKATMGKVAVTATGLGIDFANVLPGETKEGAVAFTNGGTSAEDIWIVFDAKALAIAKQAGTIVTAQIKGSDTTKAWSGYLGDLPAQVQVHDNLATGTGGTVSVSFTVSQALTVGQGESVALPFKIVATQDTIKPDNGFNRVP